MALKDDPEAATAEYVRRRPLYEKLVVHLRELLPNLLADGRVKYEAIEGRTKDVARFREKIIRPDKGYDDIAEVTDLAGLRIILPYLNDTRSVDEILKSTFVIDEANSSDKADLLAPDQFGYMSVHYVVSFRKPPFDELAGLKAEIQVRTALQHSWASTSRALQYTREADVPKELRRRLHRVSALLELADGEFAAIREEQIKMEQAARQANAGAAEAETITADAVDAYLARSPEVERLFEIAKGLGYQMVEDDRYVPELLTECATFGVTTISALDRIVRDGVKWGYQFLDHIKRGTWTGSRSFLVILLLLETKSGEVTAKYLTARGWQPEWFVDQMIRALREWKRPALP